MSCEYCGENQVICPVCRECHQQSCQCICSMPLPEPPAVRECTEKLWIDASRRKLLRRTEGGNYYLECDGYISLESLRGLREAIEMAQAYELELMREAEEDRERALQERGD